MELSLHQVAKIFRVSETQIIGWINSKNLPAELVSDQYRFHRADLLEWAAVANRSFDPSIYSEVNGDLTPAGTHLADALERGGILVDVSGKGIRDVLSNAIDGLPIPASIGHDDLIELLLARESVGSTALGDGIAVPHPRKPTLVSVPSAMVRLCYLSQPLAMKSPDGIPVDKLFLMICPTVHEHLQLLARLGALLQNESVGQALRDKVAGGEMFKILREAGQEFVAA
ncbi:Nitrogen regulatory protein [Novipirellula aureliae]|uniref:Nitrogen regulatory protein n=1 Tax=Novipirellula aureliae TaxID=2527966 RepID=A0A5C6DBI6_9BACT|nr:PTS sugar transporter subunit IIA [Novipirellula aureliae]TWU34543.1 Nitrogen regulatory protein [Novipirellula aureliae]